MQHSERSSQDQSSYYWSCLDN